MNAQGKIYKFGNNVDTDTIIPAIFCTLTDLKELAKKCMYYIREDFYESVEKGDVIVAGDNFGCGSSREVAPLVIKECGIQYIIAKSFSNIFYRNAINVGLKLIESKDIVDYAIDGRNIDICENEHEYCISLEEKTVRLSIDNSYIIQEIIKAGGLINYANNKLKND